MINNDSKFEEKRPPCRQSEFSCDLEGNKHQKLRPLITSSLKKHSRKINTFKSGRMYSIDPGHSVKGSAKYPLVINRSELRTRSGQSRCFATNRILSSYSRSRPISFFTALEYGFIGLFSAK